MSEAVAAPLDGKCKTKAPMRLLTLLIMACLSLALVPARAYAQPLAINPPKAVTDDDLKEYCIFNVRLYWAGAFFCVARRVSVQCERPDQGGAAPWQSGASPHCGRNQ